MATRNSALTPRDRKKVAAFLGHVLDNYKHGDIGKDEAVATIAYVMTALDTDNVPEAMNWMDQSQRFMVASPAGVNDSPQQKDVGRVKATA
ncbi:MAG: hypothetical protein EON49_08175 [Acidovorax sp.]|nr:MAG: hypothetical protein EON49_08175 [Acidovorax sp.]